MKAGKWIILILVLLVLLCGVVLSDPLMRFTLNLAMERFDEAEAVYLDHAYVQVEAACQLKRYVDYQYGLYDDHQLSHDGIMAILTPLSDTGLPQEEIDRCLHAVDEMETARDDLAQADEFFLNGDYACAIPLFRRSLIADDSAQYRLKQSEAGYKNQLLESAEAAINNRNVEGIEQKLLAGLSALGPDDDLFTAMMDVRRMKEDQAFDALASESRRLMTTDGPDAAFRYIADLRQQAPDEYRLEYLEQSLRHDYEEELCSRAVALRDEGDPLGACSLLEDGLRLMESQRMQTLYAGIRATIPFDLAEISISRDETSNARTGAYSTVTWDQVLQDSLGNQYMHSLYADMGTLTFSLQGAFDLFTGTVAFPLGEQSGIYRTTATLQVYGDGKLIGEFGDLDDTSAPYAFSIPVDDVQELSLVWASEGANGWKDWGRFATVFDGRLLAPAAADIVE